MSKHEIKPKLERINEVKTLTVQKPTEEITGRPP